MKKSITLILTGLIAMSLFTSCKPKEAEVEVPDPNTEYVATAGDVKIPKDVLSFFVKSMKAEQEGYLRQMGMDDAALVSYWAEDQGNGLKAGDSLKEAALTSVEEFYTLIGIAEKAGIKEDKAKITETNKEIDTQVTAMAKDGANGEEEYTKQMGVTPKQMKLIAANLLKVQSYQEKISGENAATDEEIKANYEENIATYDQATVQHILISATETMTDEEKKAAETKANEVLAKVVDKGDMKKLAAEFSEDPGSKDNSGEYTFPKGQMMKEFEDWAFAAKEGDTGIVKTDYGYHVMKFIKRETKSLKDATEKIKSDLTNEKSNEVIVKTIEENKLEWVKDQVVYDSITF